MATGIVGQTNNPNLRDTFTNMENITFVGTFDTLLTGDGNANVIIGGSGADTIKGGDGNDIIYSEDGDDIVYGEGGDDTIFMSWGDDFEDGGSGVDTLATGGVSDTLTDVTYDLETGGVYVTGTTPNSGKFTNFENFKGGINLDGDLAGSNWNITINGSGSDNDILTSNGNDIINSGAGDDIINSGAGNDTIDGGDGNDSLSCGAGTDLINGGNGTDTINLEADGTWSTPYTIHEAWNINSSNTIYYKVKINGKNKFEDVIQGGNNADTLNLTTGSDAFFLHDTYASFHSSLSLSNDTYSKQNIDRLVSVETINGGDGDDLIDLTSPDTQLSDSMTLNGGTGKDIIWSSAGTDTLNGGDGDDVLFGGKGIDILTGGNGADTFEFCNQSDNDIIKDYNKADGDKLAFYVQNGDNQNVSFSGDTVTWGSLSIQLEGLTISSENDFIAEFNIVA